MTPRESVSSVAPHHYAILGDDAVTELAGCHVELHADGSALLVVDGERLFRFSSFDTLVGHYDVTKGQRTPSTLM